LSKSSHVNVGKEWGQQIVSAKEKVGEKRFAPGRKEKEKIDLSSPDPDIKTFGGRKKGGGSNPSWGGEERKIREGTQKRGSAVCI